MASPAPIGDVTDGNEASTQARTPVLGDNQDRIQAQPASSEPAINTNAPAVALAGSAAMTHATSSQQPQPATTATTNSSNPKSMLETGNNNNSTASNLPLPSHLSTSHSDPGTSKRPRDARLIHLVLASLGVSAYQERVPLQLLDFAYRYTSSVLSDAAHVQAEGWHGTGNEGGGTGRGKGGKGGGAAGAASGGASSTGAAVVGEKEEVSVASLRIAIGSRTQYQYQGTLPKEFLVGLARERNRIGLAMGRGSNAQDATSGAASGGGAAQTGISMNGVRLPPEKYCLTGMGWGLRDEWDSEGFKEAEEDDRGGDLDQVDDDMLMTTGLGQDGLSLEDGMLKSQQNGLVLEADGADEDGEATMEDVFGPEGGDGDAAGDAGDTSGEGLENPRRAMALETQNEDQDMRDE